MDEFTERWAFMAPWCEALRGRLYFEKGMRKQVDKPKFLEVEVQLPTKREDATPATLRAIRDALLLLALLAQADARAWVHVVATHCGGDPCDEFDLLEACSLARVRFNFHVHEFPIYDPDG